MLIRNLLPYLIQWKASSHRKPLILRGARQTGKTTLIQLLGKEFDSIVSLNLELSADRNNWKDNPLISQLIKNIELSKQSRLIPGKTLLFLDEIQNEPKAIASLRYFYEEYPDLHVIATGSLMEVALGEKGFSFPVGRVDFCYLYPLTFDEYLLAINRGDLCEELKSFSWNTKISPALHDLALGLFNEYIYIGGMPGVVNAYLQEKSYLPLQNVKEGLLTSFEDDVPKYAKTTQVPYIQFLIRHAPLFAGQKTHYTNFANSGYRSREMKQAFDILEKAFLLQRIYGTTQTIPPPLPQLRAASKLLFLDSGLVCHRLSVNPSTISPSTLNDLFRGALAEQVVGQELLAQNILRRDPPFFWFRNKPGTDSETDYGIIFNNFIIPIEVKSGKAGKLRSLWQFFVNSNHSLAIRIYSGELRCDEILLPNSKKIKLLSIPFYLTFHLKKLLSGLQ